MADPSTSAPEITIALERGEATFRPGERLRGTVAVRTDRPRPGRALVVRLRWWIGEGSLVADPGLEESAVVFEGTLPAGQSRHGFDLVVPRGPLSYDGTLFQVRWDVRATLERPGDEPVRGTAVPIRLVAGEGPGTVDTGVPPSLVVRAARLSGTPQALVLGGMGAALLVAGLATVAVTVLVPQPPENPRWLFWSVAGVFVLFGVSLIRFAQLALAARRRMGPLEVVVEPSPATRGREVTVRVRFTPRERLEVAAIEATLLGVEATVRNRRVNVGGSRGTSPVAYEKELARVVARIECPKRVRAGETRELAGRLDVPADAPPSFGHERNRVDWRVLVRVVMPGFPDVEEVLPVVVLPAGYAPIS